MGAVPPCPTSGHAPAPFWGAQGCVGLAQQARGPRGGARQGTRSPSCRPGVSNEWYELPARPLIASSKTLNELLLRRAACARLVAAAAVPAWHPSCHSRCRRGWVLCYLGSVGPEPSVQPPCAGSASWGDPCDPQTLTSSPSCLPEHCTLPCCAGRLRRRESAARARHVCWERAQIPLRGLSSPRDLQAGRGGERAGKAAASAQPQC